MQRIPGARRLLGAVTAIAVVSAMFAALPARAGADPGQVLIDDHFTDATTTAPVGSITNGSPVPCLTAGGDTTTSPGRITS